MTRAVRRPILALTSMLLASLLLGSGVAQASAPLQMNAGSSQSDAPSLAEMAIPGYIVAGDYWNTPGGLVAQPKTAYSPDQYQRTQVQRTVRYDDRTKSVYATIELFDMQYYWGLKWYKNKYSVMVDVTATVQSDDVRIAADSARVLLIGNRTLITIPLSIADLPDDEGYSVTMTSKLTGMYWGADPSSGIETTGSFGVSRIDW